MDLPTNTHISEVFSKCFEYKNYESRLDLTDMFKLGAMKLTARKVSERSIAHRFESTSHLHEFLQSTEAKGVIDFIREKTEYSSGMDNDKEWSGGVTFKEALDLLIKPSEASITEISEMVRANYKRFAVKNPNFSISASVEFDTTGDYVSVENYLEGVPEVFGKVVSGEPRHKIVDVMTDMVGSSCNLTASQMKDALSLVVTTVIILEKLGYRVNLYHSAVSNINCNLFKVKSASERFSVAATIPYYTVHFFRRLCFRLIELSPLWCYGYGRLTVVIGTRGNTGPSFFSGRLPVVIRLDEAVGATESEATTNSFILSIIDKLNEKQ